MPVNLLGNALKYTRAGHVSLRIDQPPWTMGQPCLRFKVANTGPGISTEQQAWLFEPFRKGDAA